jgi:acrylyl-CoA reductase (NADPH)
VKSFWAVRVHSANGGVKAKLEELALTDLSAGDVVVAVQWSGVNYKDALAATGKGKILKHFPLNAGIDAAGEVIESKDPRLQPGQQVLVTGCGIGESFDGGFAQVLRVASSSVVPLPAGLSAREAMILGTAGFTAALALLRMEQNGQSPSMGPILVTGASGGVGSFAVQICKQNGYDVHAVSGKPAARDYLRSLGADTVVDPAKLGLGDRPLEKILYGGAIDNVGGQLLSQLLAHIALWGNVASIGMALGTDIHATVMPFILRGVSLLGTSSNNCPGELRHQVWRQLAGPWKPAQLESVVARTIGLKELPMAFDDLLNRRVQGRILVEVQK